MANLIFDPCIPFPLRTRTRRAAVSSDRTDGFANARTIYEREQRFAEWSGETTEENAAYIAFLHKQTLGGVFNVDYPAPDLGVTIEMCFARQPDFRRSKTSPTRVQTSFSLEEVL